MKADQTIDWCDGCASAPEAKQVNLPEGWREGDPLPQGLTIHHTARERNYFAFIGPKERQQRHVFPAGKPLWQFP